MSDERTLVMRHAYATSTSGIPLVAAVSVSLYRAALAEIVELRAVQHVEETGTTARDVVLLLLSYERDKASNRAWAGKLCADLGLDRDVLQRELRRRRIEGANDGE